MITFFRKALTSWPVLVLLGLVLVAFAVTGVGDPFGGGSGPGASLAEVGGRKIGETELLAQYDRVVRRARETNPAITPQEIARQGGVQGVMEQLIATTALEEFAGRIGLAASERAVDGEIAGFPAFQSNGKFDQATYVRLLAQQRLSERELRAGLRGDILRRQLLSPVTAGSQVPRGLAEPYARLVLDRHIGEAALVPAPAAVPAPTEAQLATFHKANLARFTIPERRAFRYAPLDTAALAAGIAVSDAEVRKYYAANAARFGGIEQRELVQVVLPDAAAANAFAAAVRGGESFAAAAQRLAGASAADIALGAQTRAAFAKATSAAVAAAAFAAPAGGVTAPVRSDFGWHVVSPARIVAAAPQAYGAAAAAIAAQLKADRTVERTADLVGRIEDAIADGTSFADAAKEFGLKPVAVPPLTADGRSRDASASIDPGAAPLLAKAFDALVGDEPAVFEPSKGNYMLFELGEIVPPTPVPFAEIRAAVGAAYTVETRQKTARDTAAAIVAEVQQGGVTLATALAKRGLAPAQPLAGRRVDLSQQGPVPPLLQAFLSMPPKTVRVVPDAQGRGTFIVRVDRVEPGDLSQAPQLLDQARQQFAQAAPDELAAAFALAVSKEVGVKRNPKAIAATNQRILGQDDAATR